MSEKRADFKDPVARYIVENLHRWMDIVKRDQSRHQEELEFARKIFGKAWAEAINKSKKDS